MLQAIMASAIVAVVRSSPIVRIIIPMLALWWAKRCSTFERTAYFAALAQWVLFGIGRYLGFCNGTRPILPSAG